MAIPKLNLERIPGYATASPPSPLLDTLSRPPLTRSLSGPSLLRENAKGSPRSPGSLGELPSARRRSGTESRGNSLVICGANNETGVSEMLLASARSSNESASSTPRSAGSPAGSPRVTPRSAGSPRSPARLQPFILVTAVEPPRRQTPDRGDYENFLLQNEFDGIMTRLYISLHDSAAASELHGFCDRQEALLGEGNRMLRGVYMTELRKVNPVTPVILRHVGVLNRMAHYCEYMNAFWLDTLYDDSSFLVPAYLQTVFATGYYVEANRRRWLAGRILQRYRDSSNPCALQALAALFACGITCPIGSLYGKISGLSQTYQSYVWYNITAAILAKACRSRGAAAVTATVTEYLYAVVDKRRCAVIVAKQR